MEPGQDMFGPQLAYTNGDGLCRTVHEDCSLLFELNAAPRAACPTECLVISMVLDAEREGSYPLALAKLRREAGWTSHSPSDPFRSAACVSARAQNAATCW